ncbi:hypothetical protein C1H84_08900 [Glutamicibacter soli]|uniref:Uncharacterized protein n=2 Tax=Glutamicibacter soli TaxID=453836 RepID=A0A365YHP0_9MICC|nr:hypothetical protein C1H84_08900 [Glutamicibacter soli]
MACALLLTGCSAAANEAGGTSSEKNASASPAVKELSAIEKVREANPDNIDPTLIYKSIGENSNGKYVVLGANPNSKFAKFDPKLWNQTGDNWTEAEMAKMQVAAIDFLAATMLSGPGVGGNDADRSKQADETLKKMDKASLADGGEKVVRDVFKGPDANNPFLIVTDPKESKSMGYQVFQEATSSRYLDAKVIVNHAESYDKGYKGPLGTATADIASVDVAALVKKKLVKDGETYAQPVYINYDISFVKDGKDVSITGVNIMGTDFSDAPTKAEF